MGDGVLRYLLLPVNIALRGKAGSMAYDGSLGPYFLVILLAAIVGSATRGGRTRGAGTAGAAAVLFFAWGTHQARFALPVLVLLAPVAADGFARIGERIQNIRALKGVAAAAIVLLLVGNAVAFSEEFQRINPVRILFGRETPDAYRTRLIPGYPIYKTLNATLTRNDKVLSVLTGNFAYLYDVPYWSDSVFEEASLVRLVGRASGPARFAAKLRAEGFSHLFFDAAKARKAVDAEHWKTIAGFLSGECRPIAAAGTFLFCVFAED